MPNPDQVLAHYGVPGMKWGQRKARKHSGFLKRRKKAAAKKKIAVSSKKKADSPFKDPKKMSYEDLKREVDRLEKTKKYLELTGQKKTESWVKTALKNAAQTTLQNAASSIFSSVLSNAVTTFQTRASTPSPKQEKKQAKAEFTKNWTDKKASQKVYLDSAPKLLALPSGTSPITPRQVTKSLKAKPGVTAAESFVTRFLDSDH